MHSQTLVLTRVRVDRFFTAAAATNDGAKNQSLSNDVIVTDIRRTFGVVGIGIVLHFFAALQKNCNRFLLRIQPLHFFNDQMNFANVLLTPCCMKSCTSDKNLTIILAGSTPSFEVWFVLTQSVTVIY